MQNNSIEFFNDFCLVLWKSFVNLNKNRLKKFILLNKGLLKGSLIRVWYKKKIIKGLTIVFVLLNIKSVQAKSKKTVLLDEIIDDNVPLKLIAY